MKTLTMRNISLCISMALASPAVFSAPSGTVQPPCPQEMSKLSEAQKKALPDSCKTSGLTDTQWWMIGGAATAVVAGIAIAAGGGGGGGGDGDDHSGGNTPVPPDDSGNTPVPPDDGGDTPVPPDDGGDTPVPPDDGGDDVPVSQTTTYPNGLSITMVPGADTATFSFNGQTFSGKKQSDTLWSLTDKDGKVVYVTSLDQVSGALAGFSISDRKAWLLDGTEPLGVASWTSDYTMAYNANEVLTGEDVITSDSTRPLLVENISGPDDESLTIHGVQDNSYSESNHGGKLRVEGSSIFLNSGKMNLTAWSTESIVDDIRVSDGTFINNTSGMIKFGIDGLDDVSHSGTPSITGVGSATLYNLGMIDGTYTGENPEGMPRSMFYLGGDSPDDIVTWVNGTSGTIVADGKSPVLEDIGPSTPYIDVLDGTRAHGEHDEGTIEATNNGSIYYDATAIVLDDGSDARVSEEAISLGNSATNTSEFTNNGTLTVTGDGATAMKGQNNTTLINNGIINLGDPDKTAAENGTGLVAFKAYGNNVTAVNQGTINVNANQSYIFDRNDTYAHLVNTGNIKIADDVTNWTMVKNESNSVVDTSTVYLSTVSNYTVGTTASGQAGTMSISHAQLDDVTVDTGFTAGTDAKTETFDNVFVGEDIQGTENIQSTSVVWNANAQTDESGNVDVTMTKNSYQDVVKEDAGVQDMAATLEDNYTNNALYNSLNLRSAAEVDNAMRQLSGANATSAFKEARVLSQRFNMLADNAIVMPSGFGFNLVDKNDKRAELGNDTRYDMMALSQSFDLSAGQKVQMQYGIARLDGNGIDGKQKAGDNGLTGGYSQFFGLNHNVDVGNGLMLTNALRYDVHQLESNRSVNYTGVNQLADSDNSQQYMEWRSQFSKGFEVAEGLNLTPSAGLKLRHTANDGYSEHGAGDFNLTMDASEETAIDALIGLKLKYVGSNGLAVNALVEGGPNISYNQSAQKASLQGAGNSSFKVASDQQGGGINGMASLGVSYNGKAGQLAFDAYQWKEDSVSDKGILMNYKYAF